MQTNGLATREMIHKVIEYGGKDISISLDSLRPSVQDTINGGFPKSWNRAIDAISHFTQLLPKKDSFASLGCVLQRNNLSDITDVIKFGTAISWYTSLVPIHVSDTFHPMGFRTYNKSLRFREDEFENVDCVIEQVRQMRDEGYLLYDSDQYLDDIKRFVRNKPTTWRDKNGGVCDSPSLYFAILPNGNFAPCCDWRFSEEVQTYAKDFPTIYRSREFRRDAYAITSACQGCMYGSYPEMSISMRFLRAKLQRMKTFVTKPVAKKWPQTPETLQTIAHTIVSRQGKKGSTAYA
jgi:MoaA/NifB/PqqE/SkfB family radical SAM enzyme